MNISADRRARFAAALEKLQKQGRTQQVIAAELGVAPQYLSDVKTGRREVSELLTRRFASAFGVDLGYWDETGASSSPGSMTMVGSGARLWLPVMPHPIVGDPLQARSWEGSKMEVVGPAAVLAATATLPYILRFGASDHLQELQRHDLVLMTQQPKPNRPTGAIQVIQVTADKKCYLARRLDTETWQRLAEAKRVSVKAATAVGYCLGLVWREF